MPTHLTAANAISDELTFPAPVVPLEGASLEAGSVLRYTIEDQRIVHDRGFMRIPSERECL